MYKVMKSVISAGGYKLADIQYKVKKMYAMGDLTEEQMDELIRMASGGVSIDAERPELLAMIQTIAKDVEALKACVKALESGNVEVNPDEGEQAEHPAWKQWDGISKDYIKGAIVSHNGELWESVYDGQNVWEPGAVDERFWVKYVD